MIDPGYQQAQQQAVALASEGICPTCLTPLVEGLGPYGWCYGCNRGFSAKRNTPGTEDHTNQGDVQYTILFPIDPTIGPAPGTWDQPRLPGFRGYIRGYTPTRSALRFD